MPELKRANAILKAASLVRALTRGSPKRKLGPPPASTVASEPSPADSVALVFGLIAVAFGWLAPARSRRTA